MSMEVNTFYILSLEIVSDRLLSICPAVNFSVFHLLLQIPWALFFAKECFSDERCDPWASYRIPNMLHSFKNYLIYNLN